MMNTLPLIEHIESLFKQHDKFSDKEGKLFIPKILESIDKVDVELVRLLMQDAKAKEQFFMRVDDVYVLNQNDLIEFFTMNEYFNHSFTSYTNKIGLIKKDSFIKKFDDVVLAFPYKDCVLEGGQTKDDEKNSEVFYNSIISRDEIDRLLEPKVLTNIKRFDKDGEHEVDEITEEDNLIIKGNNLLALHSLKKRYAGKVKLIYIDPPYNTGNDSFGYNDNFNHSTWLTFMKNRLEVARDLLKEDGVIFIQCDDNEQAYLKVLLDDIFGHTNFVSNIAVKAKSSAGASGGGEDKKLKKNYENILIFSQREFTGFNKVYEEEYLEDIIIQKSREKKNYEYNKILFNTGVKKQETTITLGNGSEIIVYKHTNYEIDTIKSICKKENLTQYEVYQKYFTQVFRTQDAQSSIRHKVVNATNKSGELYSINYIPSSGKNKGKMTELFYYKNEMVNFLTNVAIQEKKNIIKKTIIGTLWKDIGWDGIANEGGVKLKFGKKPERLLHRIIEMATNHKDIVLDFHLGSGTTCAVAHKMGRRYIGIEQMDYIENIAVERMKKVIGGEQGGISKALEWKGGGNFIYAELKELDNFTNSPIGKLNKNMQYLPISELEDEEYGISSEEIAINKKFYGVDDA